MDVIKKYTEANRKASDIISRVLPDQSSNLVKDSHSLDEELKTNSTVKVPFVGDFSAGKSSLLNAMLNIDLLPTNITPETSVSYELIYSPKEKLEIHKRDMPMQEYPLDSIRSLSVKPGDIVKVYLNNDLLKKYQEKGITLVDMPGIDSGIEAHNAAIASYLMPGSRYMVFSDVEQGTIRSTALSFIKELSKYDDIDFAAFLTKIDKQPSENIEKIQSTATDIISNILPNHSVGKTSAINKDFNDVIIALDNINTEEILSKKYKGHVELIIDRMIKALQDNILLLTGNIKNANLAIDEINKKKNEALESLQNKKTEAQSLDGSADDIVNDIREAIIKNSASLASMILNKSDADQINNAVIQIVRPVFVNSFKRELSEYNEVISTVAVEFAVDVDKIINESDNKILNGAEDIVGNLVGKDVVEKILVKGLEKAAAKFAGYKGIGALLKGLSKILGPIATIIVNIIPDLIRLIFGKNRTQKLAEIQGKVASEVAIRVSEGLRPEIENILKEQRKAADQQMEDLIQNEAKRIDESLKESINLKNQEKEKIQSKIKELKEAAIELANLKTSL